MRFVSFCFPAWSSMILYSAPYTLLLLFIIISRVIRPPYRSYFDMPIQENKQLMLSPRHLMLLSNIQVNSLYKWHFTWDWLMQKRFYPVQHMVGNGHYLLSLLFDHIKQLLINSTKSDPTNSNITSPIDMDEKLHSKQYLTTSEACHSTDTIFFDSDTGLLCSATDSMSPYMQD